VSSTSPRARVAILISGRGSNMVSLLDAMAAGEVPAEPALVLSNTGDAPGLALAESRGVPTGVVDHKAYPDKQSFEIEIHARLLSAKAQLVCLAGFMRVLSPWLVGKWAGRMLNVHPSLLPSFPGLDTHARALAAGVKLHGCTVHHVSEKVDDGPIVGQAAVPVLPGDDEDALAARVLAAEHTLYPACLKAHIEGRADWAGAGAQLFNPAPD
jgi:formyltetrahydrofolate-dependent phosphoribosylglycinamide formyltransferase